RRPIERRQKCATGARPSTPARRDIDDRDVTRTAQPLDPPAFLTDPDDVADRRRRCGVQELRSPGTLAFAETAIGDGDRVDFRLSESLRDHTEQARCHSQRAFTVKNVKHMKKSRLGLSSWPSRASRLTALSQLTDGRAQVRRVVVLERLDE